MGKQKGITREELRESIQDVAESLRREVATELMVTSTQIGAAERTLSARINGLQWKWAAALAGGQVVAGLVASLVAQNDPATRATVAVVRAVIPFL